jgi:hypothetical protein
MNKWKVILAAGIVSTLAGSAIGQTGEMYVSKSGDKWMLHGGSNTAAEGTEVLQAEAGSKPSDCPAGSYWLNDKEMIVSCADDKEFGFEKIPEGQKTASGADFPADSYRVQEGGMSMSDVTSN